MDKNSYDILIKDIAETYDCLAECYDLFYPPIEIKSNNFIKCLHAFLLKHKAKRVLDCACGTGREIIPLAELGGFDLLIGSDLSKKMIEEAKKKSTNLPIEWFQAEWTEMEEKVPYTEFDCIIALGNPFAHIPSDCYQKILAIIKNKLRPGGIFLFNKRNWEAELGLSPFNYKKPEFTLYSTNKKFPISPRISFLNTIENNEKEILAYFTYLYYQNTFRYQRLHLEEVDKKGKLSSRIFDFKSYYVFQNCIEESIKKVQFHTLEKDLILSANNDIDLYSEEEFYYAIK